jgi:hypothetical protein
MKKYLFLFVTKYQINATSFQSKNYFKQQISESLFDFSMDLATR